MKPIIAEIIDEWIAKEKPCQSALDLWDKKERSPLKILEWFLRIKKYEWANWFIVRVMVYKDYVAYAVYAAEQVIDLYEEKYPEDKRPREAIEAAKKCIKNPTKKNKAAAYATAYVAYAANAAADVAAYATAYVAANAAADVAAKAADAAAYAAADTAYTAYAADTAYAAYAADTAYAAYAADAAYAAYAADAADAAIRLKILKYGIKLLTQP